MRNLFFAMAVLLLMLTSGCGEDNSSRLQVKVTNIEEDARVDVHLRPVVYHMDINTKYTQNGKSGQFIQFDEIDPEMYELWISSPGYEEVRYHLKIEPKADLSVTTQLQKRFINVPLGVPSVVFYNDTSRIAVVKMQWHNSNEKWQALFSESVTGNIGYYFIPEASRRKIYDVHATDLRYFPGEKPAYRSFFNSNGKDVVVHLGQMDIIRKNWQTIAKPTVTGTDHKAYFALDKSINEFSPAIDQLIERRLEILDDTVSTPQAITENIASFKEEVNSAVIKAYFRALDDLSLMYKNELADLVILEKARVHLLFGDYSKIHKLMDEINLEGFAGLESIQYRSEKYLKLSAGYSSWLEKKLAEITNPKTRYALLEAKVKADFKLRDEESLEALEEEINDQYAGTALEDLVNRRLRYLEQDSSAINVQ
jgi:hypothetical protein